MQNPKMKHIGSHMITIDSFDDIFCNLVKISDWFECSKCGNRIQIMDSISDPPQVPCRNPLIGNNIPNNIYSFASKAMDEKNNLCSLQVIEHRHTICSSCEYYKNNTCEQCGCSIIRDRNYLNKIAIKNEKCPIGLWIESDH